MRYYIVTLRYTDMSPHRPGAKKVVVIKTEASSVAQAADQANRMYSGLYPVLETVVELDELIQARDGYNRGFLI